MSSSLGSSASNESLLSRVRGNAVGRRRGINRKRGERSFNHKGNRVGRGSRSNEFNKNQGTETQGKSVNKGAAEPEPEDAVVVDLGVEKEADDGACFKVGGVLCVILAFVLGICMEHYIGFLKRADEKEYPKDDKLTEIPGGSGSGSYAFDPDAD